MHQSNCKPYIDHMYNIRSAMLAYSSKNDIAYYIGCIKNNHPHTSILSSKKLKPFRDCWGNDLVHCLSVLKAFPNLIIDREFRLLH